MIIEGVLYSGKLRPLYADLLLKEGTSSLYQTVINELGIPEEVLDILIASEPYLAQATEILVSIEGAASKVDEFNPWVYTHTAPFYESTIDNVAVELTFESATGNMIYVRNNNGQSFK